MKLALLGYGKMGQGIAALATAKGHTITAQINSKNTLQQQLEQALQADVWLEFSTPDTALNHIRTAIKHQKPIVVGTTGWYAHLNELRQEVVKFNATVFYARNFSLGVHLFFKLNQSLAKAMQNHAQYQAKVQEWHHTQKLDRPSGTAIQLCEQILQEQPNFTTWSLNAQSPQELPVEAFREASIPGTHRVTYSSEIDELTISHRAFSRDGFISGALMAAEFCMKHHGLLTMEDLWPHA